MPGTLYVVATPIGNLEDVTLRALRILREVSVIAAEDTRRTSRLLQHYSISTPTTSLHAHNEDSKTPRLIERLRGRRIRCARIGCGNAGRLGSRARCSSRPHMRQGFAWSRCRARARHSPPSRRQGSVATGSCSSGSPRPGPEPGPLGSAAWLRAPSARAVRSAASNSGDARGDAWRVLGDRTVALGRELTKAHEELVVRPISDPSGSGSATAVASIRWWSTCRDCQTVRPP